MNQSLTVSLYAMTSTLPLKVNLTHSPLSDAQFYQLCCNNPDLAIEPSGEAVLPSFTLIAERF